MNLKKPLIPSDTFREALSRLSETTFREPSSTCVSWVNWRSGAQVKITWHRAYSLAVYFDIRTEHKYTDRDAVLKKAFDKFAPAGSKPWIEQGHGWTKTRYEFRTKEYISPNEIAEIADAIGVNYSVIYVQESVCSRPVFEFMGIPLVPGEMGKEWIDGVYHPYACQLGKNL